MNNIVKKSFENFFNNGGYVLDFTTEQFNEFTEESIGIRLCDKYHVSKGKSLIAFMHDASETEVLKLLSDLLKYYEFNCMDEDSEAHIKLYKKCKCLLDKELASSDLSSPAIRKVDREYIRSMSKRANKDIDAGEYDSAITKSRTLLEETFCYVIEKKDVEPIDSGSIHKLYAQVKQLYHMHTEKELDQRINTLLSGFENIIKAISEMRNKDSDAHGVGKKRIRIEDYHARLFVNSAITLADFILAVGNHNT